MRCSPLLEYSSTGLMIIALLGGISALLGAAGGLLENDMKRIIAFSTTSQLGYMIISCGLSQYNIALFHLINHAWFKAMLFLAAGSVIHAVADIQDIRKMGGLILLLPRTYAVVLLGSLSLMAFPFLTGFYSKDFLLELALIPRNTTATMAYVLALTAAILTATYSAKMIILTFISKPHYPRSISSLILDPPILMTIPLLILSLGSAFFGYITHELFLGIGTTIHEDSLFTHPNHLALLDGTFSSYKGTIAILKTLPPLTLLILLTMIPVTVGAVRRSRTQGKVLSNITPIGVTNRTFSNIKEPILKDYKPFTFALYVNILQHFNVFNHWIMYTTLNHSVAIYRSLDRGILELLGPLGLVRLFHYLSFRLELLATGFIPHYAFIIVITVVSVPFIYWIQFNI